MDDDDRDDHDDSNDDDHDDNNNDHDNNDDDDRHDNDDTYNDDDSDDDDDEAAGMRGSDKNGSGNQCWCPPHKALPAEAPSKGQNWTRSYISSFSVFPLTNYSDQIKHLKGRSKFLVILSDPW